MAQTSHRQSWPSSQPYDTTAKALPLRHDRALAIRRLLAWGLELGLLVSSAVVPWYLGDLVRQRSLSADVPLSPLVVQTQVAFARATGQPRTTLVTAAPPLTNGLWLVALGLPVGVAASQLYWLQKSGKTLPKYWLGLTVVDLSGAVPGLKAVLLREVLGRWGAPTGAAYLIWLGLGAFPHLPLLGGLTLSLMLAQGFTSQLNGAQRTIYDRWAGTRVRYLDSAQPTTRLHDETGITTVAMADGRYRGVIWNSMIATEETGGLTAIILSPVQQVGLDSEDYLQPDDGWRWLRRWGGIGLVGSACVAAVFLGNWLYDQQARRWVDQPNDQLFLALVDNLSLQAQSLSEKQAATLALASTQDPRAVRLLVDLLAQTGDPALLNTLQQALVTLGPPALPYLRQLNQTLANDLVALPPGQREVYQMRQQTVKRTITKILVLHSGRLAGVDLSQTDLGQVVESPDAFTLMLEQQNLAGLDWRNAMLLGARFRKTRFFDPGTDGRLDTFDDQITDLSGSDLTGASLVNAWLRRSNLRSASLLRANLSNVQADFADLTGVNASSAYFIEADLQHAVLDGASLIGADLTSANLTQAHLHQARLRQVNGDGANLTQADLTEIDASDANFSGTDFSGAVLQAANFTGSRLAQANFNRADLRQANLQNADLTEVNFSGALLAKTNFAGAQFAKAETEDIGSFIAPLPDLVENGSLANVDFSQAVNLDANQLQYICEQGGVHPACGPNP